MACTLSILWSEGQYAPFFTFQPILIVTYFLSLNPTTGNAQVYYTDFIKAAEAYAMKGDFENAIIQYDSAFIRFRGSADTRYEAARANALTGDTLMARKNLWTAFHLGFVNVTRLLEDTAFDDNMYYNYDRLVRHFHDSVEYVTSQFNIAYKTMLDTLSQLDQGLRYIMATLEETFGDTSKYVERLWRVMRITDSIASYELDDAIAQYGFPGNRLVGSEANKAACLILIHAPLSYKLKHEKAFWQSCEQGTSPWDLYAYFWDHIISSRGSYKMKYGTTYTLTSSGDYIMEPEDPDCINHYRETVGLPPFESYRDRVCKKEK